jgi:hypothetical protein
MSSPVVVVGMPNGDQLPAISGEDAITRSQLSYLNQERSIVKVGGSTVPSEDLAEWIFVENLDIHGANSSNGFRGSDGQTQAYASNAASIHVQVGRNI